MFCCNLVFSCNIINSSVCTNLFECHSKHNVIKYKIKLYFLKTILINNRITLSKYLDFLNIFLNYNKKHSVYFDQCTFMILANGHLTIIITNQPFVIYDKHKLKKM